MNQKTDNKIEINPKNIESKSKNSAVFNSRVPFWENLVNIRVPENAPDKPTTTAEAIRIDCINSTACLIVLTKSVEIEMTLNHIIAPIKILPITIRENAKVKCSHGSDTLESFITGLYHNKECAQIHAWHSRLRIESKKGK